MNKGIPDTFASMGVPVFYQDMLSYGAEDVKGIASLLKEVHWHYAARILEAAEVTARTPGPIRSCSRRSSARRTPS